MHDAGMEAWSAPSARVPRGLRPGRAWRYCVLRTLLEARRARRRNRPMPLLTAERLFSRKWHATAADCRPRPLPGQIAAWGRRGREMIRFAHEHIRRKEL